MNHDEIVPIENQELPEPDCLNWALRLLIQIGASRLAKAIAEAFGL